MKIIPLIMALLHAGGALFSQATQALETVPIGKVIYLQQLQLRSTTNFNGSSTLLFNASRSIFIQNAAQRVGTSIELQDVVMPVTIPSDPEGFPVYTSYSDGKIWCKVSCKEAKKEHCILTDTVEMIDWVLHLEHKRFGQFNCRRATGKFRGREYEVWYAMDIPVPGGPYKLGGLPGLILEARSLDGQVTFLFNGLEMATGMAGIILPPKGLALDEDYGAYYRKNAEDAKNQEKEFQAKGYNITVTPEDKIEIFSNR